MPGGVYFAKLHLKHDVQTQRFVFLRWPTLAGRSL